MKEKAGFYLQLAGGKTIGAGATEQGLAMITIDGAPAAELTATELQDFARLCVHFGDTVRELALRRQHVEKK